MARLIPCPSCGRHVRAVERDCPFCGRAGLTTNAPSRLGVLLLGLCLAACTSPTTPAEVAPKPAEPAQAEPEPEPETNSEVEQPKPQPESQPQTTGADETTGSEGTDQGAALDEPTSEPPAKPKYGAPRPDPRPAKKYGAPPLPDF